LGEASVSGPGDPSAVGAAETRRPHGCDDEAASTCRVDTPQGQELVTALTERLLTVMGEYPGRSGLVDTPSRVARSWRDLTVGYRQTLEEVVNGALFPAEGSEMVVVRDIELVSLCEHHLLPFHGRAHVAYLPSRQVIGLSKVARIVDMFARRLQVQERITTEVADALESVLDPIGVAVVVEARHMCMTMRGVGKAHSETATSVLRGPFRDDPATRSEFLSLISNRPRS
jgi:GTP cyclohydrolase I